MPLRKMSFQSFATIQLRTLVAFQRPNNRQRNDTSNHDNFNSKNSFLITNVVSMNGKDIQREPLDKAELLSQEELRTTAGESTQTQSESSPSPPSMQSTYLEISTTNLTSRSPKVLQMTSPTSPRPKLNKPTHISSSAKSRQVVWGLANVAMDDGAYRKRIHPDAIPTQKIPTDQRSSSSKATPSPPPPPTWLQPNSRPHTTTSPHPSWLTLVNELGIGAPNTIPENLLDLER